jgi:hypothetical protein
MKARSLMGVIWHDIFDEVYAVPGASEAVLVNLTASLARPLSSGELGAVNGTQRNPFPINDHGHSSWHPFSAETWVLPRGPLPPSYLAFLQWSNGGEFRAGKRWFQFVTAGEVRSTLLSYHFPQYMPGALPFAMDGDGGFYVFDMRRAPIGGEYPILTVVAGNLGYDEAKHLASSFIAACRATKPYRAG